MPPKRRGETSGAEPAKRRRWTPDEEAELQALVGKLGPDKWPAVAQRLGTGRSAAAVEQHWRITPRASAPSAPREEASAAAPKPAKRARKSTAKRAAKSAAKPMATLGSDSLAALPPQHVFVPRGVMTSDPSLHRLNDHVFLCPRDMCAGYFVHPTAAYRACVGSALAASLRPRAWSGPPGARPGRRGAMSARQLAPSQTAARTGRSQPAGARVVGPCRPEPPGAAGSIRVKRPGVRGICARGWFRATTATSGLAR